MLSFRPGAVEGQIKTGGSSRIPSRRPRVMLVCERARAASGVSRVVLNLLQGLDRRRVEPLLCLFAPGAQEDLVRSCQVPILPLKMTRCDAVFHRWDWRFLLNLCRTVRRERVDVLHAHTMEGLWYGSACKRLTGVRLIYSEHRPILPVRRGWLTRRLAESCDVYTVVSRAQGLALATWHGLAPERLTLLYNGVDGTRCRPDPVARRAVRHDLGLAPDVPVLISVGRLAMQKCFPLLIQSFAFIHAARPDTTLLIIGNGPQHDALAKLANDLGLGSSVRLLGARTDVPRLLACADLFVSTSRGEGLSIAWQEAAAAGLPVVGPRVDGAEEAVVDGVTGRILDQTEPEAFSAAVLELLAAPDRLRAMGRQARERVLREFTVEGMVEKVTGLYEKLAAVNSCP